MSVAGGLQENVHDDVAGVDCTMNSIGVTAGQLPLGGRTGPVESLSQVTIDPDP